MVGPRRTLTKRTSSRKGSGGGYSTPSSSKTKTSRKSKTERIIDPIKIMWAGKVSSKKDMDSIEATGKKYEKDELVTIRNRPVLRLDKTGYDKIRNTIATFSPEVQTFSKKTAREGPFFITDGKRWLAVDPQGYDYPRYKSPIYVGGLTTIRW